MQKILSINLSESDGSCRGCLINMEETLYSADNLALKLVEEIGEDDLQAVYAFLSDLTAELAAISDRPEELADDHWHKVIDKKKQFNRLKNGLKYYSLKNWLEDKKS